MARVAILIKELRGGGPQRAALTLAREMIGRGHAIDLLFRAPDCDYPHEVPEGIRFFYVTPSVAAAALERRRQELARSDVFRDAVIPEPAVPRWQLRRASVALAVRWRRRPRPLFIREPLARTAFKVAAYLDRERPDAVLTMGREPPVWAAAARHLSARRVWTVAELTNSPKDHMMRVMRRALASVDAVVAVSRGLAGFAIDVLGVPVPVHAVYRPLVDADRLRMAAEPVDHSWIGGGVPVVLSAGHLGKDYPTLLRAAALLAARRPVRLIVLGKGKALRLRELQALAQSLGIAGAVDFAGFVSNPFAYMAQADLFVLAAEKEGMPQVLVQAMMAGCRLVATDCPFGPAELLGDGEYGRLAPVGDPARLAEAMERELDTPRDAARLRARAAALFGVERAVDEYERLLLAG